MRAAAPGKLVVSGAYSVLDGASALVAAVDRYAVADMAQPVSHLADEVRAAIALGALERAPALDATALRHVSGGVDRKLGLGSSAAIVVPSIAAAWLDRGEPSTGRGERIMPVALESHRRAQRGGSGIDVAASCLGGVLRCWLDPAPGWTDTGAAQATPHLHHERAALPAGLCIEVYGSTEVASTRAMLATIRQHAASDPTGFRAAIERAKLAAEAVLRCDDVSSWIAAQRQQIAALAELGDAATAPIVTRTSRALDELAAGESACFGPSGAGGGDVSLWFGPRASSPDFRARALDAGLFHVPLKVGATGVHPVAG